MILAVTHPGDSHGPPVLHALRRMGARVGVLDFAEVPRHGRLTLTYGTEGVRRIPLAGGSAVDASRVTAVWWRRPRRFRAAPGLGRVHAAFAVRQAAAALMGCLAGLERHALFVNPPWRDQVACHKAFQLTAAEHAGLRVPETLITSDPLAARAFLRKLRAGATVHKAVHSTPADWRLTRRVTAHDVAGIAIIRHAPVILQQRIPGVDVRVTVVGDEVFAADIDARESSSPDDFRGFERECRFAPCRLPAGEERALRRLMRDLGLHFGAADFRRDDEGRWFFLEVNPGGQWDFVEERTGQPITAAVAALLASREPRRARRR